MTAFVTVSLVGEAPVKGLQNEEGRVRRATRRIAVIAGTHLARAILAEVIRVGVAAEEANERIKLAHAVLEGRARQAPLELALEVKASLGDVGVSVLDVVGLVKDDAVPVDLVRE